MIGVILITLYIIVLLQIRQRVGVFAKNCLPLTTSCISIFIFLPLLVGVPFAFMIVEYDSDKYQSLSSIMVGIVAIIFMLGVTLGAIIVNYLFNKYEMEKKAYFVVNWMKKTLTQVAVRSTDDLLRVLYDQYVLHGNAKVSNVMEQGTVVFWWPLPEKDPDMEHNKILLSSIKYQKLKMLTEKKKNQKKNKEGEKNSEKGEDQDDDVLEEMSKKKLYLVIVNIVCIRNQERERSRKSFTAMLLILLSVG